MKNEMLGNNVRKSQSSVKVLVIIAPAGFGPEAKTRGGIVIHAYIEYIYIVYTGKI